jgi:hypothetical protein
VTLPGRHYRIEDSAPKKLAPFSDGVAEVGHLLNRRAEHAKHTHDRCRGRLNALAKSVVVHGLYIEEPRGTA